MHGHMNIKKIKLTEILEDHLYPEEKCAIGGLPAYVVRPYQTYYKNYMIIKRLVVPLTVLFRCAVHEPAHNNSCCP
jgi:hypothetical protein